MAQDTLALLMEGYNLKRRMDADKARLAAINQQLARLAEYRDGSATGHIYAGDMHAKVVQRSNVKWHQPELEQARKAMGDDAFFKVFKWEYKPLSAKALNGFFDYGALAHVEAVKAACEESYGAPTVTYERVDDISMVEAANA